MPYVVLDTSVVAPGLVSAGRRRALLTLCRYGTASLVHEQHRELIDQLAEAGTFHGPDPESLAAAAAEEVAMLSEVLPLDAPNDLYLVMSPPILRETVRKLVEKFDHVPHEAAQKRFLLAVISANMVPDFDPSTIDRLAPDRNDDMIVHTALEARADLIITTDKGLLVEGDWTEYSRLDGRSCRAVSLEGFADSIETSTFSLEQVPDVLTVTTGQRKKLDFES